MTQENEIEKNEWVISSEEDEQGQDIQEHIVGEGIIDEWWSEDSSSWASQQGSWNDEVSLLKEKLVRLQADYDNFKKRTEREREEMIFFINSKTFSRILPRLDDLERIVSNTPEDLKWNTLFAWVEALYKTMTRDIEWLWVKVFVSKGQSVDPERHDVMTQIPWEEWIILDEFEKGYMLWERVLRHAKVVVGSGN